MQTLESLRRLLQERGQLTPIESFGKLSTGFPDLDRNLGGGYPQGAVTELVAPLGAGAASLALTAASGLARRGGLVAYLDPSGTLDPSSVQASQADPERFLWIRPGDPRRALEATDLLAESGNFPLVILDLLLPPVLRPAPPTATWMRLANRLRGHPCSLLVMSSRSLVGALARITLELEPGPVARLPDCPLPRTRQVRLTLRRNRQGSLGSPLTLELDLTPPGFSLVSPGGET